MMTTKKDNRQFFIGEHVSDDGLALLSDAFLNSDNVENIPGITPEVLDHIDRCHQCKDKIMDVVLFLENPQKIQVPLKQEKQPEQPQIFQETFSYRNKHFFTGKIAAVFLVCALFVGGYFLFIQSPSIIKLHQEKSFANEEAPGHPLPQTESQIHEPQDTETAISTTESNRNSNKPSIVSISRYAVNPSLENMIGSRTRSVSFEALTPPNNSVIEGDIVFSWKQSLSKPHSLKIVDNRNKVLFNLSVTGKELKLEAKINNGLYYWKLENENELLHVGKFYIGQPDK